ncbi:uncharacterized protein LOC120270354 [Dioscorea cayenensis subsp. rotundata]|uniref:Uncharacterized protein LOC120270354 n=1 Tax=Dioscorea cayennensis subsp. rotundata TaxID=55577 RepID=A0AB40C3X5_DIOCR|nr:uncharacterized protein LOC120270354 [Dioscorea cayenensis subsp. rotundata]
MGTDRKWMYNRLTHGHRFINPEFVVGVESFIQYACDQPRFMDGDEIRCPCCKCQNRRYEVVDNVKLHLLRNRFTQDYRQWVCHGEPLVYANYSETQCNSLRPQDVEGSSSYRDMIIDAIGPNFDPYYDANEEEMPNPTTQKLYDMLDTAKEPLWPGCESHTQLSAVARLLTIKSEFQMSERCYDTVLQFMKEALPTNNKLVDNFYNTKKFVAGLGLLCEKIHCCKNGCMLYWGEDSGRRSCKVCDYPRYKSGKRSIGNHKDYSPNQKMYYFPLTPRLQKLYVSKITAKDMRWHKEHDKKDGMI